MLPKPDLLGQKNLQKSVKRLGNFFLGSMDTVFCVLLNVGLFIEIFHGSVPDTQHHPFIFSFVEQADDDEKYVNAIKHKVYSILRPFFERAGVLEFLGSHSIQSLHQLGITPLELQKTTRTTEDNGSPKEFPMGYPAGRRRC